MNLPGPKLDVVCSSDDASRLGFALSCADFVAHVGDVFIKSGEIAQRLSEDKAGFRVAQQNWFSWCLSNQGMRRKSSGRPAT